MRSIIALTLFLSLNIVFGQDIEEKFRFNKTYTHGELIDAYRTLDKKYKKARLIEYGLTDSGRPLHLFILSNERQFDPSGIDHEHTLVFMINNAIHPGEPCGVDASLKMAEELLRKDALREDVVLIIIPMYNVGGALQRGCCSRANQDGPQAYGFRGNSRNLDLNRDFIKCDSRNAREFTLIFQEWEPDLFLDTHTTNGADYPYAMTLISSQYEKSEPLIADHMRKVVEPYLYGGMKAVGYPMCPYMNSMQRTPSSGIQAFLETPRFSSGYASLYGCFAFISEAHMLKTYETRVMATYELIKLLYTMAGDDRKEILDIRQQVRNRLKEKKTFALNWELDTTKKERLRLELYDEIYEPSEVTGMDRLRYDSDHSELTEVDHFPHYRATSEVEAPKYYVIPQAWGEVVERLQWNGVEMFQLDRDVLLSLQVSYISAYETTKNPYEGHYLHYSVETLEQDQNWFYRKGDYVVPVDQEANRYIVESLEPKGVDSYFAWGFFDAILQQKEWFSDYVFEETALEWLEDHPVEREEFELKRQQDSVFASNHFWQLYWIYQRSPNFEPNFNRYPVGRIFTDMVLPLSSEH